MSISEASGPINTRTGAVPFSAGTIPAPSTEVRTPVVLGAGIAMLEGTLMALEFLFCAIIYHFIVLNMAPEHFAWSLYFVFSGLLGAIYAGFSIHLSTKFFAGDRQPEVTLPRTAYSWTAAFGTLLLIAFLTGTIGELSRASLTAAFVIGLSLALAVRSFSHGVLAQQIAAGELRFQKVAVIGTRTEVVSFLLAGDLWRNGQSIAGTLYLEDITSEGVVDTKSVANFANTAIAAGADYMVLAGQVNDVNALHKTIHTLKRFDINVTYALSQDGHRFEFLDTIPIGTGNTLRVLKKPLSAFSVFTKRTVDILGALFGILVLSPVFLITALAIKLDSPGPVIFRQARRGFNGASFSIFKFRSMSVMEAGNAMRQATRNDARITRIGKFLRASSIDELPQLVNVLLGDMSLVGPRPHALSHDDKLDLSLASYAFRQRIKPGITGWAQVNGYRGETISNDQMEGRTKLDLHYIDNWSVFLDLWILVLTVFSSSSRRNAY